ncbi:hypothetical protein T4E_7815 [Trichinella pseudospiralis]|uniref:Uncharacterized protein n=1 Tax=Trichinella pseudospiralis TaxID=6337 RepID=A0A0V0YGK0_TRIPS|nr:hypothetical protein T4E_7815 [Trichinella pseudospiralis]
MASLKGRGPANGSLFSATRQRRCFVISSTSDWMPRIDISLHAGNFHSAVSAGYQVGELGGGIQVASVVYACFKLSPESGEFQNFP